ncbi:hypothetical protein QQP08_005429 [Theobroma cacao]|nr:hypothetical protein QQP08_005429 [Theobroma cacao]
MENLTKLKHLDIKGTPISQMPPNFGNLKRLHLLTNFVVGNNIGSTISEVKDLSLLHGNLSILRLQNVSQTADAEKANLKDKKYLRELILEWDVDPRDGNAQIAARNPRNGNIENAADNPHNGHAENAEDEPLNGRAQNAVGDPSNGNVRNAANDPQNRDAEIAAGSPRINGNTQNAVDDSQNRSAEHAVNVLDKLQPAENLERLQIKNFFGMSLPRWLGNALFSKMKSITLENCQNCNSLPPLGQLPSLKELAIYGMAGVKIVGPEFYGGGVIAFKSLETIWFENMENWEQCLPFCNEPRFPSLHTLILFRCRKLTGDLPTQHLTLEEHIQECDNLKRCQGPTNE